MPMTLWSEMKSRRSRFFSTLCLVLLATALSAQPARQELYYSAEVKAADAKRIHFTLEIRNPTAAELVFEIPFWAPGAYRPLTVSSYGGKAAIESMDGFSAEDGEGRALQVTSQTPRRFSVAANGAKVVRFRYTNNDPNGSANNRSYLVANAGLLDGPRSWAWLHGAQDLPVMVRFLLPQGWQVACGLERTVDAFTFHADDYDRLVDAPVALGLMERWVQHVRGVPHEIVALTAGRESSTDVPALQDMVRRIVECSADIFGDMPYTHYSFLYTPGGGGLEHLGSTSIGTTNPARITVAGARGVTAHEYFHTYNVKRMRPFALGPFDYSAPVPVDDLWICEGLTNYYTNIVLWRGGLITDSEFCSTYRASIGGYEGNPAHLECSPQESSRGVWTNDSRISYYLQGEVLGLALDLLIREGSDNRFGLEQAMRRMYRDFGGYYRHGAAKPGFASADFPRVIREVSGVNVDAFFANHIRRAQEVDWNRYLASAGMSVTLQQSERSAFAAFRRWPATAGVDELPCAAGTPLAKAGLQIGDKILALDDKECANTRDALRALAAATSGSKLSIKLERAGAQRSLNIVVPVASELSLLTLTESESTVVIQSVPDLPTLADSGLKAGDVLLAVGERAVSNRSMAQLLLAAIPPGTPVKLKLRTGSAERSLTLKCGVAQARKVTNFEMLQEASARQKVIREGLKTGSQQRAPER